MFDFFHLFITGAGWNTRCMESNPKTFEVVVRTTITILKKANFGKS